jgi:hypothetical protein
MKPFGRQLSCWFESNARIAQTLNGLSVKRRPGPIKTCRMKSLIAVSSSTVKVLRLTPRNGLAHRHQFRLDSRVCRQWNKVDLGIPEAITIR